MSIPNLGRNDPCHCGSGRKYKKCCLDQDSGVATDYHHARSEWEKRVVLELFDEYAYILHRRRIPMQPAGIALTDSDTFWAKWNPLTRTILFSRKLIQEHNWFQVVSILRHEMAHQLLDESYIPGSMERTSHDGQFRLACERLGVPEEYSGATICLQTSSLDWRQEKRDEISERMLEKVRKLLSLATSSNEHEALLAMNKVREIYAKYNLEEAINRPKFAHVIITHGKKRIEAHQSRIISILVAHFFVQVITTKLFDAKSGEHHAGIEIVGTRENAMMAEYVYHFLLQQTDHVISEIAKTKRLSRIQRKSYRLGILSGFDEKLKEVERVRAKNDPVNSTENGPGLIALALTKFHKDPALERYLHQVYPGLSTTRGSFQYIDKSAFSDGHSVGKTIMLNRPVAQSNGNRGHLLK